MINETMFKTGEISMRLILLLTILASCKNIEIPQYETVAELDCDTLEEPIKSTPSKINLIYDGYYEIILPNGEVLRVSGDCVYRSYSQVRK